MAAEEQHESRAKHDQGRVQAVENFGLAKFVVDEIARWAGPIKENGLQVD